MIELNDKSFTELDEIIRAAKEARVASRERAIADFEESVAELKDLAEGLEIDLKPYFIEKKEYPPKYRNPDNMNETFNGRGPRPRWLRDRLFGVPKGSIHDEVEKYLIEVTV